MKPGRLYLNSLTIARGLAAWLVIAFHLLDSVDWMPWPIARVIKHGYLSVDFFFLLSGFVIWMTAHQEFVARGRKAIWPFWRRRFARIYPLYAVMLGLTVLFVLLLEITGRDTSGYPWGELPLHISMTQNWGFTEKLTWNHPAWSLSTEMAAYLLFPLLALCLPISRMPRWMLLLAIGALITLLAACFTVQGIPSLGDKIPQYGIVRCLFQFIIGAMLCAFWLRNADSPDVPAIIIPALMAAATMIILLIDVDMQLWAFPLFGASAILAMAEMSRRFPPSTRPSAPHRFFIYLGEISYATYLSHFMLFIWFKIIFVTDPTAIPVFLILLYLVFAFILSTLLYHFVELPGRRWLLPHRKTHDIPSITPV